MTHLTGGATRSRMPSQAQAFDPRPLPATLAACLRAELGAAHAESPFSTVDPRSSVRRVVTLVADLPVRAVVYRGGLDLRGAEVDHVWLAVAVDADGESMDGAFVLDVAFPLFADSFVEVLRRFVAGDAPASALQAAAVDADLADRVLGEFPAPMRYVGRPVWSAAS
jgi:hypothetical protein